MRKLIEKHQQSNGKGRGIIQLSPEAQAYIQSQLNFIPGMNTTSNSSIQQANQRVKQQEKVDKDTKAGNKRIADKHAHRAVQERDQRRRTPNVDVTKGYSNGTIQDADKIALNKVLSWYGLSNGLGQMTNVSDQMRSTPEFANFVGKTVPLSMATTGSFLAAPQTALFGLGTSMIGSNVGGKIGKKFGNEQAGQTIGSFVGPIAASGFNAAILPTVRRTFANEFGTSYGYNQLARVPYFAKTLLKGGAKEYPKIKVNSETGEQSVSLIEKSKPIVYTEENPAEIVRAQATTKYSGAADSETPYYIKNSNGSYQYNVDETPFSQLGLFRARSGPESIQELNRKVNNKEGNYIVSGDFLGNNGGGVGVRYDGQFTLPNGETYNRYMMRDVWDLQPVSQFASKAGEAINNKIFFPLGAKVMDKAISAFGTKKGTKLGEFIWNTGDKLEKGITNAGKSRILNREVGRIVGAKPFTLEHPFAVKTSLLEKGSVNPAEYQIRGNTLNIFKNENVPGTQYSTPYELNLDMPFDFNRINKNLVYPLFNVERTK